MAGPRRTMDCGVNCAKLGGSWPVAMMPVNHPLAAKQTVRLRDCARYPVALAEPEIGGRQLLDEALARHKLRFDIVAQSNSFEFLRSLVIHANLISFQIRIGTMPERNKLGLIAREIDDRDVPRAKLVLGQLRARNLPIAAAVFAERLARVLEGMRDEGAVMLAAAAPA